MADAVQQRTIDITQANRLVMRAFRATTNGRAAPKVPMLWGPPGIGKSEMVQAIADWSNALVDKEQARVDEINAENRKQNPNAKLVEPNFVGYGRVAVVDIRLPLMEPTDIKGMPYFSPVEETMKWAPSEEFPDEEMAKDFDLIIVFLDEINAAPGAVQAASYQLILNRRVGTYKLPQNVRVICAGNGDNDGGVTYRMPTPLQNSMVHFQLAADFETWVGWAVDNHIHPDIIGYLGSDNDALMIFDPKSPERAWPSPRTWSFMSDFIWDAERDG